MSVHRGKDRAYFEYEGGLTVRELAGVGKNAKTHTFTTAAGARIFLFWHALQQSGWAATPPRDNDDLRVVAIQGDYLLDFNLTSTAPNAKFSIKLTALSASQNGQSLEELEHAIRLVHGIFRGAA